MSRESSLHMGIRQVLVLRTPLKLFSNSKCPKVSPRCELITLSSPVSSGSCSPPATSPRPRPGSSDPEVPAQRSSHLRRPADAREASIRRLESRSPGVLHVREHPGRWAPFDPGWWAVGGGRPRVVGGMSALPGRHFGGGSVTEEVVDTMRSRSWHDPSSVYSFNIFCLLDPGDTLPHSSLRALRLQALLCGESHRTS